MASDPALVFAEAATERDALADPHGRICYESLAGILHVAAARTRRHHFGLLVSQQCGLSDIGILGELTRNSPTVGAGLGQLVLHDHLNSDGFLAFLTRQVDEVRLGFASYAASSEAMKPVYDAVLAATVKFMRELTVPDWSPSAVYFPYSRPRTISHYRAYFQVPLNFNSPFCSVGFSCEWLKKPVAAASPERLRRAQAQVKSIDERTQAERTYCATRQSLLLGSASGDDVAEILAMDQRKLNRALKAEGATFQQVLDRVRFSFAKELLENSALTLPEISEALCSRDESSLVDAYRRWTAQILRVCSHPYWPPPSQQVESERP